MKKFYLFASLAGLGLMFSCSQEGVAEAPNGEEQAASYTVSVEEALAHLQSTMDGMETRAAGRTVSGVEVLLRSELSATRAAGDDEPLAYVVNFDEGGYAILGADLRQEPVIAIVNENSMTPETLIAAKRAVDAGGEVDTPTFVNALVAEHLERALAENAPLPRIGTWEIKENKNSMMITKWGQNKHYGYNLNPATVAISQIFVYNKKFNRAGFTQLGVYFPNWTQLNYAAVMREPAGGVEEEVFKFCSVVDGTILGTSKGCTTIETVFYMLKGMPSSYKMLQIRDILSNPDDLTMMAAGTIRSMLYGNNMPIYMEGVSTTAGRHAWVLDGWQMQQMSNSSLRQYLVYCNFGQDGVNDGLYSFGLFRGYNSSMQIITYNFGD